jgi:hypothetical protein
MNLLQDLYPLTNYKSQAQLQKKFLKKLTVAVHEIFSSENLIYSNKYCKRQLRLFDKITSDRHHILLKELLLFDPFATRLRKIQNCLFLRRILIQLLTVDTACNMMQGAGSPDELNLLFKNILLSCSVLQPEDQNPFYAQIHMIYRSNGFQPLRKIEEFFPLIFDFEAAPSGFLSEVVTIKEQKNRFFETIASFSDAILRSLIPLLNSKESVATLLQSLWKVERSVRLISWEEFAKDLVMRTFTRKPYDKLNTQLQKVEDLIYKECSLEYLHILTSP